MLLCTRFMRALVTGEQRVGQQFLNSSSFSSAQPQKDYTDVPEGHEKSDLSSTACHIGLGRRRDLTLRQDLRLWSGESQFTLADVFKGKKVLLFGFPGGKVCTEQHVPGYIKLVDQMRASGVDKVVGVAVGDPSTVQDMLPETDLSADKMCVYADKNGGFVRLLGLDLTTPDGSIKCQRFAGIMEDGILMKLEVEEKLGDCKRTDASSMLKLWEAVFQK